MRSGARPEMRMLVRKVWTRGLLVGLVVAAILALPACASATHTPDAATILREAQAAKVTDLSFTATGIFASALGPVLGSQGTDESNLSFQATVTGKITSAPQRADLALALGQNQSAALEIVTDTTTQTGYVRLAVLSALGLGSDLWIRVPLDSLSAYLDASIFTTFERLAKPVLVGTETIHGVAVYHLQGTQQLQSGIGGATEDFYVRQDTAYPVRVSIKGAVNVPSLATVIGADGGQASVQVTIDFTGVNSGASIPLPAASQIIGG